MLAFIFLNLELYSPGTPCSVYLAGSFSKDHLKRFFSLFLESPCYLYLQNRGLELGVYLFFRKTFNCVISFPASL